MGVAAATAAPAARRQRKHTHLETHVPTLPFELFYHCKMNYSINEYNYVISDEQLKEAVSGFVKFLVFLRSTAKYKSTKNEMFETGSLGFEDTLCDFINMGYVKCSSVELDRDLTASVDEFAKKLRESEERDGEKRGKLTVVFYETKTRENSWLPTTTNLPWEMWVANITVIRLPSLLAKERHAKASSEKIVDIMLKLATDVNRASYLPDVRAAADSLDLVFCTKYADVQPFLFKIVHETGFERPVETPVAAIWRFFSETLGI